jgi:hypothetical protein
MTSAVHYDTLLAPVYAWMIGDLDAAGMRAAAELHDMHVPPPTDGIAVDLGAGLGLHAIALAKQGFKVLAVDDCPLLLDHLRARTGTLPITAVQADLLEFRSYIEAPPALIVCMGDTLTHLPSLAAVETLVSASATSLCSGGMFGATFRDYASKTLHGNERFSLVRRDATRILSCFLDYAEDHVMVHDLLTERRDDEWVQRTGSYPKLRLAPEWLMAKLAAAGLQVRRETAPAGMVRVVGIKA